MDTEVRALTAALASRARLAATLSAGATVHYSKGYDAVRGNDRADEVIGGFQEEWNGGGGGGGGGRGGGAERRIDADGSGPFTKQEFVDEYGGYAEWDAATPA